MAHNVNRNKCLNIIYKYGIEYNESNNEEINKEIKKKDYYVSLKISDLIDSVRIIKVTNKWFILEFNLEENKKLVKDLNNLFAIKQIGQRRVRKKNRTWLCDGKLICYL